MNDATIQVFLLWAAVTLYAASTVSYAVALIFKRETMWKWGGWLGFPAFILHSVALGNRWVLTGHGPYLNRFEVAASTAWLGVLAYFLILWRIRAGKILGVFVMPITLLLIGFAVNSSPFAKPIPLSFQTYWLVVHILFAKLAYGSWLIGAGFAALLLYGSRRQSEGNSKPAGLTLPGLSVMDDLSYRFIGFGFVMLGVMIVAGAIWANKAWGSYWSWDPIETWSLISWLSAGIYLHLRRTYGWKAAKAAVLAIVNLGLLIFVLFGIGFFYVTTHTPYFG